jgi:hypothetical protein
MKQIIRFSFITAFIAVFSFTGMAQLKTYTWDSYKMKFKIPTNSTILASSGTKFSCNNGSVVLEIQPRKGEYLTYEKMKSSLSKWAASNNLDNSWDIRYMDDLNGYWGVYIDTKASNGLPTTVCLLVDPDFPEISFYVWLQYNSSYYQTAVDVLASFIPV